MAQDRIQRKRYCHFCKEGKEPDYKDTETLRKFITERSKIVNRARTGVCARHQRRLGAAVKRARIIAVLPFVPKI